MSLEDRRLVEIRTGAARIALGQDARPGQSGRLTLLPVGLHFADRTRFWTDVVVSIGDPIDLAPFGAPAIADEREAVRALTAEIQRALEGLILNLEVDRVALVHAIEEIYGDEMPLDAGASAPRPRARDGGVHRALRPRRPQAGGVRLDAGDALPEATARAGCSRPDGARDAPSRRACGRAHPHGRARTRGVAAGADRQRGALPAVPGERHGGPPHRRPHQGGGKPHRRGAGRLSALYAALAFGLRRGLGWPATRIAIALAITAGLGVFAIAYTQWLKRQWERIRLVFLAAANRRQVARLRRERRALIRMCESSRREYLATRTGA